MNKVICFRVSLVQEPPEPRLVQSLRGHNPPHLLLLISQWCSCTDTNLRPECSVPMVNGLDAKIASCFFKNSRAISGHVSRITWTLPRSMQPISVFISFIGWIHWKVGLFRSNCGRFSIMGHGIGPGGRGDDFWFLCVFRRNWSRMKRNDTRRRTTDAGRVKCKRIEVKLPVAKSLAAH